MMQRLLLAFLVSTSALCAVSVSAEPFGIQSNEASTGSSSYAGSLAYDSDNNVVFVTGSTYGTFWSLGGAAAQPTDTSNCFFGILKLPATTTTTATTEAPSWIYSDRLGTANVVESCSSLLTIDSGKVYIGGQAEESGLLTSLRKAGQTKRTQYGTLLDLDVDLRLEAGEVSSSQLLGGRLFHATPVQTTRAMTATLSGDALYVVSQESDESDLATPVTNDGIPSQPNWIVNDRYGENYLLEVSKILPKQIVSVDDGTPAETLSRTWHEEIATTLNPVNVAGIDLISPTVLLLAGSAIGSVSTAIPPSSNPDPTDWEGFVTLLSAANGGVMGGFRLDVAPATNSSTPTFSRIEGICRPPKDESTIYLVGSTNGQMELTTYDRDDATAFLVKMQLPELTIEWAKQLDAKAGPNSAIGSTGASMMGYKCAVTEDGALVYVGGVVKDSAIVNNQPLQSKGADDIFVALVDTVSQEWKWIRQLGTMQDEFLSDLTVDKDGNGIVLGNTRGSFMRQKASGDTASDVFVISLTKDTGDHTVAVEQGVDGPATTAAPAPTPAGSEVGGPETAAPLPTDPPSGPPETAAPLPTDPPSGNETGPPETAAPLPTDPPAGNEIGPPETAAPLPTPPLVALPTGTPAPVLVPESRPSQGAQDTLDAAANNDGGNAGTIAVIVVLLFICTIVGCFLWQRHSQFGKDPDGAQVLEYLKGFDDVEVDLKHSATGGYHGTYVNHDGGPRFYSDSGLPPEETVSFGGVGSEMSPLTHSSIIQDSLFSLDDDDDDGPTSFGGSGGGGASHGPGAMERHSSYRGLVDVYNNTWNDMSQHRLPSRPRPLVEVDIDEEDDGEEEEEESRPKPSWGREII